MKKLSFIIGVLLFSVGALYAQNETNTSPVNGAVIQFENTVHDYGDVPLNGNGECEFEFTNTGNEPLILSRPTSTCGCTVPSWPKQPILPGEKEKIKVTYNTRKAGPINKTVTVTSNDKNGTKVVLRIKGRVLEEAKSNDFTIDSNASGMPFNNQN